ncbi:hypothetical protein [Streptomyces sp. NPDC059802]
MRDAVLKELITEVYETNFRVYEARKVWRELHARATKWPSAPSSG